MGMGRMSILLVREIGILHAFEVGRPIGGYNKTRYKTGLSIFGSGGALLDKLDLYAEPFPLAV
jgi:hypothetical protein